MHVLVVNLSTQDDNKFKEQLISGITGTIKWNKSGSEMTKQTKTNSLNYLIDPTFNKSNRLFVLSFENEDDRIYFSKYYTPKVETKDFNVFINGNFFFSCASKKQRRRIRKIIEMRKNNDYTTVNLLDNEYFSDLVGKTGNAADGNVFIKKTKFVVPLKY